MITPVLFQILEGQQQQRLRTKQSEYGDYIASEMFLELTSGC
jgi:hypothetical protein